MEVEGMDTIPPAPLVLAESVEAHPELRYPEMGERYRSIMVDAMVLVGLMFTATWIFDHWPDAPGEMRFFAFLVIFAGYEPVAISVGCTLGNYVMGIRVVRARDGSSRINIFHSYLRYAVKVVLGWLSFLTVGSDARRRALHDMASGSLMVKVR
jgi:uncharacterized RDD family membrane protein YckC